MWTRRNMRPRRPFKLGLQVLLSTGLFVLGGCAGGGASTSAPAGQATTAPSGAQATAAPAASGAAVTLSLLVDQTQTTRDTATALVSAYTAGHPNVTINIETR